VPVFVKANSHPETIRSTFGNVTGYENTWTDLQRSLVLSPAEVRLEQVQDKDFRVKIARKAAATNPYQRMVCRTKGARVWCDAETPFGGSPSGKIFTKFYANTPYFNLDLGPWLNHDPTRDLALTRLRRKLDNLTSQAKLLPPLVEAKELKGLIRSAATLTYDVLSQLHDLKKGNFRNAYRRFSDAWLGLNFGLKPMLKDIEATGKSIAAYLSRESQPNTRVSASAVRDVFVTLPEGTPYNGFNIQLLTKSDMHVVVGYRFVAGIDLSIFASNDYSIFDQLGLMPVNLPSAAWELTAFSWVADYFGTIGTFLEDTFRSDPFSTLYVSENRRCKAIGNTSFRFGVTNPQTVITYQRSGKSDFEFVDFQRYPRTSIPVRSLRLKTADEIGLYHVSKLLNLVSVLGK
jgi:ribosomal protein L40E